MEPLIEALLRIAAEKDSLEIGTAGKGGAVKVYGNFGDIEEFQRRIDNALSLRRYAALHLGETPPAGGGAP